MELAKKTTILLSPEQHRQLVRLARERRVSIGHLIRSACARQYGLVSKEDRLAAARALIALSLPAGDVKRLKKESVPDPDELLP